MALGHALAGAGQPARGIRLTQDAIEDAIALFGPTSRLLGVNLKMLAEMQWRAGQRREARQSIDRAYSILVEHFPRNAPGFHSLVKLRSEIELDAR